MAKVATNVRNGAERRWKITVGRRRGKDKIRAPSDLSVRKAKKKRKEKRYTRVQ
jgi:hypothetical protein